MTVEAAIILLIWIIIIVAVAWVLVYIAGQMRAPPPVSMVIWAVAFLLVLLVLLRHIGVLHAETLLAASSTALDLGAKWR